MADIKECIKEVKEAQRNLENARNLVEGCERALEDSKIELFDKYINGKTLKFPKLTRKYGEVRISFSVNTRDFFKDGDEMAESVDGKITLTIPKKNGMNLRDLLYDVSDYVDFNLFFEPCVDTSKVHTILDDDIYHIEGNVKIWGFYLIDSADYLVNKKITIVEG